MKENIFKRNKEVDMNNLIIGSTASAKTDFQQIRKQLNLSSLKEILYTQDTLYTKKLIIEDPLEIFNKVLSQLDSNGTYTFFPHRKQLFILEIVTPIAIPTKCYQVLLESNNEPTLNIVWKELIQ